MKRKEIVLDADGITIDYHAGYAMAWERAFGEKLQVRDPHGHHPIHYWDVPILDDAGREHLRTHGFTEEVWANMPAIASAKEGYDLLIQAGFKLHCVTALAPQFQAARESNLRHHGFVFESLHAVGAQPGVANPKLDIITKLAPAAFVDDYRPYFQGVPRKTWRALVDIRPHNSPNHDHRYEPPNSRHPSLRDFAKWWIRVGG